MDCYPEYMWFASWLMERDRMRLNSGGLSHTVLALLERGYRPVVLDSMIYGHRDLVRTLGAEVIVGDIGDDALLDQLFRRCRIDAVMHFAAYAYVGESVENPGKYYQNNVAKTVSLLNSIARAQVKKFIFFSSCATYGVPSCLPMAEDMIQNPVNPYGHSKRMIEQILRDFDHAYGLRSVSFRYFNAAGADPEGRVGERHDPETHLIPLALKTALGHRESLKIFGNDYQTSDGSCIRDYIHVSDLADAHVLGLQYLEAGGDTDAFNLGNGRGCSVLQVIDAAERVTGKRIKTDIAPRRPGDPPELYASAEKASRILRWYPKFPEMTTMISHAWQWHQKDAIEPRINKPPLAAIRH